MRYSFLVLLVLLALGLRACLGGQRAHGVADGLIVGVNSREVFQNTLEELWILHDVIVLLILNTPPINLYQYHLLMS